MRATIPDSLPLEKLTFLEFSALVPGLVPTIYNGNAVVSPAFNRMMAANKTIVVSYSPTLVTELLPVTHHDNVVLVAIFDEFTVEANYCRW